MGKSMLKSICRLKPSSKIGGLFVITIILLLAFYMPPTLGQKTEWSNEYIYAYGRGNCVINTNDGNFVFAGTTNNLFLLAKADSTGELLWWKTYQTGEAMCVVQTSDNGYAMAGSGDVNLIKTDSSGKIQWTKNFMNESTSLTIRSLSQTSDNGFILAGYTPSGNAPQWDLTIKTDDNGSVIWSKSFGTQVCQSFATNVLPINDGYVLAANSKLYNLDLNGNVRWSQPSLVASCLISTNDGGYLVVSGSGSVIDKTNSEGKIQWSTTPKLGSHYPVAFLHSAIQTADGGFGVCVH